MRYLFLPLVWPHGPIGHLGDPAPKVLQYFYNFRGGVAYVANWTVWPNQG
jgi:hypothetical protein